MGFFYDLLMNLPEVAGPTQKRLAFNEKLKWTIITLILFFLLGLVPLFGLGENALKQFEFLSMILGAKFGSLISLGIGPIVTASIVLQLLNGSGIMKFDLTSHEGKKKFQGYQKLLAIFFIIFEAAIYVLMGGLAPSASYIGTQTYFQLEMFLIFQLFLGGILILFMDEIISKWGFGSGISLFIAAGVSEGLFTRVISWLKSPNNPEAFIGAIPELFRALSIGEPKIAGLMIAGILATILVFVMAVYSQAMKIEIPLSFGRVRGHGIRWPLNFIYTSNIPVILVAALLANVQLWSRLLQNATDPCRQALASGGVCTASKSVLLYISNFFGTYIGNVPDSGLIQWLTPINVIDSLLKQGVGVLWETSIILHSLIYMFFFIVGSVIFSWFWMQTAGMDAKSQAKQIMSSGLQIPGFRKDQRILERILDRYIKPLTVMGGITVGILAATADLSGALANGTGILLTVMIVYRLYEEIAKQHMMDMHPALRKFMSV